MSDRSRFFEAPTRVKVVTQEQQLRQRFSELNIVIQHEVEMGRVTRANFMEYTEQLIGIAHQLHRLLNMPGNFQDVAYEIIEQLMRRVSP